MAKDRLSMRKFKEVLRLKYEHELTNRKIAKSCAMSHVTVGKYLTLAQKAGITWPLPDDIDDADLEQRLYQNVVRSTYMDLANHYGITVIPARPGKPKDKAKVESAVLVVERWILAALRNHRFFSLAELNQAISGKLTLFNQRPLQKMKVSRQHLFETIDRPALAPLPAHPYEFAQWKKVTANIDYHVEVDRHFYSVPYQLRGQKLDVSMTATTIAIFDKNRRVASHLRSYRKYGHTTVAEHMPKSHQRYLEWTPSRIINWAAKTGPCTQQVVTEIMQRKPHPEQGFRSCLGVMRLGKRYSPKRLEKACERAVAIGAFAFKNIESILKNGLDNQPLRPSTNHRRAAVHPNIRGPHYYHQKENQP